MNAIHADVSIRDFQPGDEASFRRLNEEWITRYFVLEAKDRKSFDDPQSTILNRGGRIFLAIENDQAVGCCALVPIAPNEFEVAKMAVTPSSQGAGVGRRLLSKTIAEACSMGATRLYIETNHTLAPAIHLYESLGFKHIPYERVTPSPYARADVYMELLLSAD